MFPRLRLALRWWWSGPGDSPDALRVAELEAAARLDAEERGKLESQMRLRDLTIKELLAFTELSRARLEAWQAIEQRRAVAAERTPQ